MSNPFTEAWLQDVVAMCRLPALNPSVAKLANAAVETQLRIIIQQANSFQRKGKASELKGKIYVNHLMCYAMTILFRSELS